MGLSEKLLSLAAAVALSGAEGCKPSAEGIDPDMCYSNFVQQGGKVDNGYVISQTPQSPSYVAENDYGDSLLVERFSITDNDGVMVEDVSDVIREEIASLMVEGDSVSSVDPSELYQVDKGTSFGSITDDPSFEATESPDTFYTGAHVDGLEEGTITYSIVFLDPSCNGAFANISGWEGNNVFNPICLTTNGEGETWVNGTDNGYEVNN